MKSWLDNLWREGLKPGSPAAISFALLCFALASLVRLGLHFISPDVVPFATYFAAVLITALIAGRAAAALVAVLGVAFSYWAFIPPYFAFGPVTSGQVISMLIYGGSCTAIIWAAQLYRRMIKRIQDEENYRRMVVEELEHRVKNKLATIYAILNRSLQGSPEIWKDVSGRLKALAVTDEFIARADGQGALLRDILEMELTPYDKSRAMLSGPDVRFSSKVGTTVALIIHELTTNAAKYGALSNGHGHLEIAWKMDGDRVGIDWIEKGGPEITEPTQKGFGTFLAQRALAPFQGQVEMRFEPQGLNCNISFTLPD